MSEYEYQINMESSTINFHRCTAQKGLHSSHKTEIKTIAADWQNQLNTTFFRMNRMQRFRDGMCGSRDFSPYDKQDVSGANRLFS